MNFKELIEKLDPEIYQNLKMAVEIGKWPDGRQLNPQQRELSLQAIIAYEIEHDFPIEQRIGFVDTVDSACHKDDGSLNQSDEPSLLKWRE